MTLSQFLAVTLLSQAPAPAATPAAGLSAQDLQAGQRLFVVHCGGCHGIDGRGGRGPSLARPKLRRVTDDKALGDAIRDGLSGTEMPAIWHLSDAENARVVAYVRSLGKVAAEPVPGDAVKGRAVYTARGCALCHVVAGEGGIQGPELTDVGARRAAAHLRESLLDPAAAVPDGFLVVRARAHEGREVTGLRLNEDPFSIQIRDLQDRVHSFRKDALLELVREPGRSTMPSYRGLLTEDELRDLVAYLASLGREP
jgi:putative heme-binding domain-containing protein